MGRPKVVVYQIASVDGRLAFTPDIPMFFVLDKWNELIGLKGLSIDVLEWIKATHHPQAFVEGSGSFVRGDQRRRPLPRYEEDTMPLYEDYLPDTVLRDPRLEGWGAVVDSRGIGRNWLTWVSRGIHGMVWVSHRTPPEYLAYLRRKGHPYLVAGQGEHVDLAAILDKMASRLGVTCLCSTGGGRLNGAFVRQGLVDEIDILIYPAVVGGMRTPSLFDSPDLKANEWPTPLTLLDVQRVEPGHVWLRYEVVRG